MPEGSFEATIPQSNLLWHALEVLIRRVVNQDRKNNEICDMAVSFQEEV